MVTIKIYTGIYNAQLIGFKICEALKGDKPFINNDIIVNYDIPGEIVVTLGTKEFPEEEIRVKLLNEANRIEG